VETTDREDHNVVAPGFASEAGRFQWRDGDVFWQEGGETYGLLDAVLRVGKPALEQSLSLTLDTTAFFVAGSTRKLGLGSSAALCAALATALHDCIDAAPTLVAMEAHRELQSGRGSGADVAASLAGGVIDFRMEESGWTCLDWPDGLHYRLYFSGTSTSTTDKIRSFDALERGAEFDAVVALSHEIAERFREPTLFGLLGAFARYTDALRTFDTVSRLGIFANGHADMTDRARSQQVIYKPCGAGGGDVGIALAHEIALLDGFDAHAVEQGFVPLETRIDQKGARLST
jgi:phosphomevalonate kinase